MLPKKGLNLCWEPFTPFSEPTESCATLVPRGWQIKAIQDGIGQLFQILNAPTGSGKSFVTQNIVAQKLHRDPNRKAIIAFPMSQIAQNFAYEQFQMPDGAPAWAPLNICNEINSYGKTKRLTKWLQDEGGSINNRVAICTYSTLLRVPRELLLKIQPIVWFDEAHHANCETGHFNQTGVLLAELMQAGCQIGLSTATLFRGDRCSVIPEIYRPQFHSINVSYEEHLRSMRHIRGLTYDFHTYVETPETILHTLLAKDKSTIVYLPHVGTYSWRIPKKEQISKILDILGKGETIHETIDGIHVAGGKKIVDLVTNSKIPEKQKYIGNGKINPIDYVLALGRCKEGTNIPQATRIIIIGARQSLREVVQIVGRLLRDHPNKETVEVHHLVRWDPTAIHAKGTFSNYLASIYFCFLLGEVIAPKMESLQYLPADQALKTLDTVVRTVLARKIRKQYQDSDLVEIAKTAAPAGLDSNKFANELAALMERQDSFIIKELLSADSNQFCGRVLTADLLQDMQKDHKKVQEIEPVIAAELPVKIKSGALKPTQRADTLISHGKLKDIYAFYHNDATPGERAQVEAALESPKWSDEWEGKSVFLQAGFKGDRTHNEAIFMSDHLPAEYYQLDRKRARWWNARQSELDALTKERDKNRVIASYECQYPYACEHYRHRPVNAAAACQLLGSASHVFRAANPKNPLWILQGTKGGAFESSESASKALWQKWALIRQQYQFGYEPWSHCDLSREHTLPLLLKTTELKAAQRDFPKGKLSAIQAKELPFNEVEMEQMQRHQFEIWNQIRCITFPYKEQQEPRTLKDQGYVDMLRSSLRQWWFVIGHGLPVTWLDYLAATRKDVRPVTMLEVRNEWDLLYSDHKRPCPFSLMLLMESLIWCDSKSKPGNEDWNSTLFLEHELLIREQLCCVPDLRRGLGIKRELEKISHQASYKAAKAAAFEQIEAWPNGMRRSFRSTMQHRWA